MEGRKPMLWMWGNAQKYEERANYSEKWTRVMLIGKGVVLKRGSTHYRLSSAYINLWLSWKIFQQQVQITAQTIRRTLPLLLWLQMDMVKMWASGGCPLSDGTDCHHFYPLLSQNGGSVFPTKLPRAEYAISSTTVWWINHGLLLIMHLSHYLITAVTCIIIN